AADRRLGLGRDLDEVEVALLRIAQRVVDLEHADLLPVLSDETHLWDTDALVDPRRIAFWRAPVESARDRHYRSGARVKRKSGCAALRVVRWPRRPSIAASQRRLNGCACGLSRRAARRT